MEQYYAVQYKYIAHHTACSLPICQHTHEPCAFYCSFHHFLVSEAHAGVVPLTDVAEVVDVRFERRIILVVDVPRPFLAQRTLFFSWIGPAGLLVLRHGREELEFEFVVGDQLIDLFREFTFLFYC